MEDFDTIAGYLRAELLCHFMPIRVEYGNDLLEELNYDYRGLSLGYIRNDLIMNMVRSQTMVLE